ncbi:hypothetical protein RvY_12707 [Ramazzottius varieornatus]|uniref:Uncharacterized protein n=1 Tax=Ramazzottius varieornatus TaxID=947166 RepID=A0A1D1VKE7_RAMVA|nr:hypothetical protein RvY_12707 [Ramazzottius varieornatus]
MSDSESGSQKERDDSQPSRRCRFAYQPCHLIALLRQVAAKNPKHFVKVRKLFDDQDKKMSKLPKSGTEEQYKGLKQLLEEVALLRKEEARHHTEKAAKPPAVPAAKKSSRKARGVTEVQQGKNIQDPSMDMMKRRRDTDGEEEHEINGHMGVNTRNLNRKAEHGEDDADRFKRYRPPTGSDNWLTFCRLLPRPNKSTVP